MTTAHIATGGDAPAANSRSAWLVATLLALVGIAITLTGLSALLHANEQDRLMRFERYNAKVEATVFQRFDKTVIALKGLRSTILANGDHIDRLAFRTWVAQRHIDVDFPGLRGLGFIERVKRADLATFVARERADAAPQFQVRTSGNAPDLLVIKFIEPIERNHAAWGYDVGSEPIRRSAAQRAIDSGTPTLTHRITLVQDGKKRPGFLYYLPVYRLGARLNTQEERRAALVGLLYAPIVVEELLAGMEKITDGLIDFELFDTPEAPLPELLFDLDGHLTHSTRHATDSSLHHTSTLHIGGRQIALQSRATQTFQAETRDHTPIAFGVAGLMLSALLGGLFWVTSMSKVRAESLAQRMTQDLRASQQQAELLLRDQRALLQTLDRHCLISVTTPDGVIQEVNDAFCAISGYSREALVGSTHRLINSGHHDPFFWIDMWRTISSGESWQGEICNRSKDGRLYWVSSIVAPFRGADGKIEKYVSIRQDITRRKQLEKDATEMAERYTLAIEGGHDGLWDWMDVHAHAEWWSPQFYRLLGFEPGEIPADITTFDNLLHPEDQPSTFEAIEEALKELSPFDVEYRLRTKSGEYRWFRSRAKVYFDGLGYATRMAGSIQDIHERKLAKFQLREHIDQMMAIFSLTPDAFVSFDRQHRVNYASPAFEALTGLAGEALKGCHEDAFIEQLNTRCHEPKVAEAFLPPAEGGAQAGRVLLEMLAPSGRALALSVQRGTGSSVSQIVHLRDVTRELELDRMKGEFMSMAAHELRTPMASIYGFTELLLTRDIKPEKQRDLLQRIFRQSEVMVNIINELLDLARIEAKRGADWQPTNFDLAQLVDGMVRDFQPPATRQPPILNLPPAPLWVHADPQKTQQAVLNVLSNAFKYSPDGGDVEIGFVCPARIASQTEGARLGVRITDRGIGLTPEQLRRIGERFYRADKSGAIPGTGLGVSIVKETLRLMGGALDIESVHGEGTTVTLWLPATPMPPGNVGAPASPAASALLD